MCTKWIYPRLGLKDPLSIAWELVPYSFVADWFIPIGAWLQARGLQQAVKGTFVSSLTEKFEQRGASSAAANFELIGASAWRYSTGVFTRTVEPQLKIPYPEFKPLGKILSWQHCENAIALLINAHGSKA